MKTWDIEEMWATCMLMLFATGGYLPVLMNGLNSAGSRLQLSSSSSPVARVVILIMWLGTLVPVLRVFPAMTRFRYALRPLAPYILLSVASIAWSQDSEVSTRKVMSFLLSCLFGLYFAVRFHVKRQLRMVFLASSVLAIASLLLVVAAPRFAVDHAQHAGAWQGVFSGKNGCAMVMVIGLAAGIVYRPARTAGRVARMAAMALFAFIIHMADSSGALVVAAVLWTSMPLLRHLARYEKKARAMLALLCICGAALLVFAGVEYLPLVLKVLHRDPTLTGRTDIWKAVFISIFKHPLLGYGYGAFWLGLTGESANVVMAVRWALPNAHNGFLDIWLSLGAAGLAFFCYAVLSACSQIWNMLLTEELRPNLWLVSMLVLTLVYNFDESVLIASPNLMWTLFTSVLCGLQLWSRRHALTLRAQVRIAQPAGYRLTEGAAAPGEAYS
jgi:O-antigen ligase